MGLRGKAPDGELRILRGTNRDDRTPSVDLKDSCEQLEKVPPAPSSLGQVGKSKWLEIGEQLKGTGYLEQRFLSSLEQFCQLFDDIARHRATIEKQGEFVISPRTGFVTMHPAGTAIMKAQQQIQKWFGYFGLTPISSKTVRAQKKKDQGLMTRKRG